MSTDLKTTEELLPEVESELVDTQEIAANLELEQDIGGPLQQIFADALKEQGERTYAKSEGFEKKRTIAAFLDRLDNLEKLKPIQSIAAITENDIYLILTLQHGKSVSLKTIGKLTEHPLVAPHLQGLSDQIRRKIMENVVFMIGNSAMAKVTDRYHQSSCEQGIDRTEKFRRAKIENEILDTLQKKYGDS